MKHEMRRSKQAILSEEAYKILGDCTTGVLSIVDEDGAPYGVPMNYVLEGNKIYLHGSLKGRRASALESDSRASFCVIAQDSIVPADFSNDYQSVIAEGPITVVEDAQEKHDALIALAKLTGRSIDDCEEETEKFFKACMIMRIDIEEISGKESKSLSIRRRLQKDGLT